MIKYLIFCFGAGLIQIAYTKQSGAGGASVIDAPFWFYTTVGKIIIPLIAIGSFIVEVILGFVLIAWWAGVFLWIPAVLAASMIIPSKNPAAPFFLGILIVIGATVAILFS